MTLKPTFEENGVEIYSGDCREVLRSLPDESVNCVVTSPPYWGLRDYGCEGQIGLEDSPVKYISTMREVFAEVRRVLRSDGTLWLNMGDSYATGAGSGRSMGGDCFGKQNQVIDSSSYPQCQPNRMPQAGLKPKDLVGIPWMLAFALREDGWYLRQDIIWSKPNPMPESVTDRCTKAHEYIFLLSKSERYYYNQDAIKEPASWNTHERQARAREDHKTMPTERVNGIRPGIGRQPKESWNGSDFSSQRKRELHPNIGRKMAEPGNGIKNNSSFDDAMAVMPDERNKRSVWTVNSQPFPEAHFATFPEDLIKPCILAGCPPAGKRCDCDQFIESPIDSGPINDPTLYTGRAGMNRPRRPNEGTRPITKGEQRQHAEEMKASPYREKMRELCGSAFDHYIRTDHTGARPLPEPLRQQFLANGWITPARPCGHPVEPAGIVLDPFGGSGTTAKVARELHCKAILVELNPDYIQIAARRLSQHVFNFAENRAGGVAT